MSNSSLFKVSPEKFLFPLETENIFQLSSSQEKISKEIEIKIINISTEFIITKIKTTKRENYIMNLSCFVLEPKEEKIIKIRFKRDKGEKLELKSHRIQFEGSIISKEEKDLKVDELYKKYIKAGNKENINNIIAKTSFIDKNGNDIASLSSTNITDFKSNIQNNETKKDNEINNNEFNLLDLSKASNIDIIIALSLALVVGFYLLS